MNKSGLDQRQINALAAVILIIAGLLFVLTEAVIPAIIGLVLTIIAGVLVFLGTRRKVGPK